MANFTIPFVTVLQPVNYDRVSGGGGPGYSTVVEFMCTCINRQRKRASIIIKSGPRSYEFIYWGGGGGGGGHVPRVPPPPPPGSAADTYLYRPHSHGNPPKLAITCNGIL